MSQDSERPAYVVGVSIPQGLPPAAEEHAALMLDLLENALEEAGVPEGIIEALLFIVSQQTMVVGAALVEAALEMAAAAACEAAAGDALAVPAMLDGRFQIEALFPKCGGCAACREDAEAHHAEA